jgi:hypothetical protein
MTLPTTLQITLEINSMYSLVEAVLFSQKLAERERMRSLVDGVDHPNAYR